jgi:uncharacterized protein
MATMEAIRDFLAQQKIAVVGVSGTGKKFGNVAYRDLKSKGYEVFAVNPRLSEAEGDPCWADLTQLPTKPEAVVIVVPPSETEKVVRDARQAGITRVWMQQGAESKEAQEFCEDHGMSVIAGLCIMMFSEPVGTVHRVHRFFKSVFGSMPR